MLGKPIPDNGAIVAASCGKMFVGQVTELGRLWVLAPPFVTSSFLGLIEIALLASQLAK